MPKPVALVTGASAGIGEATVLGLLEKGYGVYAAARRVERMESLAAKGARVLALDVTSEDSITAGVQQIVEDAGRLDVLVNNAGYGSFGSLEDVPIEEARRQFEVNIFGLARLIQLALPHMRAQRSGRIVNVSSMGGKVYEPLGGWYHATKFALEGLSDSLRLEVKPFGIQVVVVEPGAIHTEWSGIAADNLESCSGGTAYAEQARMVAAVLRQGDDPRRTSSPKVIADVILEAVEARRPKTRYVAGAGARPALLARKVLPDKAFDAVVLTSFRLGAKAARRRPSQPSQPA